MPLIQQIDDCMYRQQNQFFKEELDNYETVNKTSKTLMKLINEIENEYEVRKKI
jgi:hypothetical protein